MAGIEHDDGLGGPSHLFAQTDSETPKQRFLRLMEENFCIYCGSVGADHVCEKTCKPPCIECGMVDPPNGQPHLCLNLL